MKNIIIPLALFTILFDFSGFCLWKISGQKPVDGFYVGALTQNMINVIK